MTEEQLPVVGPMGGGIGSVPGSDTAFAGGSIDAFCEQIVAGANRPGDVLVIFGATLIVWVVTDDWKDVGGLLSLPHTEPGLFLIGGPSNAGALFADWVHAAVGGPGRRARGASDPESGEVRHGDPRRVPVWLPYLRGERTPFHDPELRASVHDLDISQGSDALIRGALGGEWIRHPADDGTLGRTAHRIVATGGGSRSIPWMQAVADATGLPVDTVKVPEGAALGAAFLARMAAGLDTSFGAASNWARPGAKIDPDPAWTAAAAVRFEQFEALSPRG